jgi:DNA repair exonuclease SbcCD ATPase subunit
MPPEGKARRILELRSQGKTYREIQRLLRVSPNDIARALRRESSKDELLELKTAVQRLERQLNDLKTGLERDEARLGKLEATTEESVKSICETMARLSSELLNVGKTLGQQLAELKLRVEKSESREAGLENWAKSFSESMRKALDALDSRLRKLEERRGFLK